MAKQYSLVGLHWTVTVWEIRSFIYGAHTNSYNQKSFSVSVNLDRTISTFWSILRR